MSEPIVIGIDLGTTYSAVATLGPHGQPEIIPNREGERITPSVVLFDGDSPLVGSMAKRSAVAAPLNICQFVKRQMGEREWRFVAEDGREFTAEEVSSVLLRRLKEDAEAHLGKVITGAAITVPAYFNDAQRKATKDAAELAGLKVLRILNEPTAAALAYGYQPGQKAETILVYDLGGGTFDVTLMRTDSSSIEVIATHGDKNLGGFDWDNVVMNLLIEAFETATGESFPDEPALQQDLRDKAEIAKKTLSNREKTKVFLSASGRQHTVELTRKQLEDATRPLLTRTGDLLGMVLEDAKTDWVAIDKVLLVGGSTRMPMVTDLLLSKSGKAPSPEMHPDEVVALGAAIQAGLCMKEIGGDGIQGSSLSGLQTKRVSDVISHSLGVVTFDSDSQHCVNSIIIPRNTTIPVSKADTFSTVADQQQVIRVRVTEGEESDIDFVRILGEAEVNIPPYPVGAPVEITFTFDANGIFQISVRDLSTGRPLHQFEIKRDANRGATELAAMKRQLDTLDIQ